MSTESPDGQEKAPHHGVGHRERLRKRILSGRDEALAPHEIVEYLLALAIPRRDVKPLAKQLLETFGGLPSLLAADAESLVSQPGMGETSAAALKTVQAAARRMMRDPIETKPVLSSGQQLLDYLHADMAHLSTERVRVLYLNAKNMLIRDERMSDGTVDQAAVYIREVIRRALDLGASAMIVVHNHPSGDPTPSRQDISLTREIEMVASKMGIALHDHIIIGREGHSSLRAEGLI